MTFLQSRYLPIFVLAIAIFGFPVFDKLVPMSGSEEAIRESVGNQLAWCVGLTYSSSPEATIQQRVYVLFPFVFSSGSLVDVRSTDCERPSASEIDFGVLFVLPVYAGIALAVWKLKSRSNSNQTALTDTTPSGG